MTASIVATCLSLLGDPTALTVIFQDQYLHTISLHQLHLLCNGVTSYDIGIGMAGQSDNYKYKHKNVLNENIQNRVGEKSTEIRGLTSDMPT